MTQTTPTATSAPERLTEEEARRFIEHHSARYDKLRENVVTIRTRAEEARRQLGELLDTAESKLGTRDDVEIQRIHDERLQTNGTRAAAWIRGIEACEAELASLNRVAQPGR